jgi:hypothetical protein
VRVGEPLFSWRPSRRTDSAVMASPESDQEGHARVAAFQEELQKLGWAEGRNIRIDYRSATFDEAKSIQRFAKELVALQPDLILSNKALPGRATTGREQMQQNAGTQFLFTQPPHRQSQAILMGSQFRVRARFAS